MLSNHLREYININQLLENIRAKLLKEYALIKPTLSMKNKEEGRVRGFATLLEETSQTGGPVLLMANA